MQAFKGFDKDLKCRDFQFEVGKTYKHDGDVKACSSGFHACEHPMHVFRYYAPNKSRFCLVEVSGTVKTDGDKLACSEIKIVREVTIKEMIGYATEMAKEKKIAPDCNSGAATASGYSGAATASGNYGAATASGDYGRARGKTGCALFLVFRKDGKIIHAQTAIVGKNKIKPDVFYTLDESGKFVEVK